MYKMLRVLPDTDKEPSLADHGDSDEEEEVQEEDFMGIVFPSTIFSYLFLFLKPSCQPLTPNLAITVDLDFL